MSEIWHAAGAMALRLSMTDPLACQKGLDGQRLQLIDA